VSTTADHVSSEAARPLAAHHPIGISTGVFASARGDWPGLVADACRISTFAVELSALSGDELPGLLAYLRTNPRMPFRYVAVHAPAKSRAPDEAATIGMLAELPLWVRSIVAHPDTLSNVGRYRALGTRLVLENMDDRKFTGRVADEMEKFFEDLPHAGFCLDVAHVRAVDPTMDAAHELLDRFRARLRHVHLSSLDDGHHVPLNEDDERLFVGVLNRCRDVPWILEALPPDRWAAQLKTTAFVVPGAAPASEQV
jgi:sugar phosphate isomerase/epimerase